MLLQYIIVHPNIPLSQPSLFSRRSRTYDEQGSYRARLRVFNLASEFEMTSRVAVWAEIKNLTTMAYFLPFLPIGKVTHQTFGEFIECVR